MRSLWRAVAAAVLFAGAVAAPVWAQPPATAPPAPVVYQPPPGVVTMNTITAFVSLTPAATGKVYVTVTEVATNTDVTEERDVKTGGCEKVQVTLPKRVRYRVRIHADFPLPTGDAGGACAGGKAEPQEFEVTAPPEETAGAPGATTGPGSARGGGRGGGKGSYSASGASKPVFTGPRPQGRAAPAAAADEGFEEKLPYGEAGSEEPQELGADETSNSLNRSLAFVAAGLLTLAVFLHLRWLNRQAAQPGLTP